MAVQFRTAGVKPVHSCKASASRLEPIFLWINHRYAEARIRVDDWVKDRKIVRSRRTIANLPEHIRQDIGWPAVEDRVPGRPANRPRTGQRS